MVKTNARGQYLLPRLAPGLHSVIVTAKDEFGFEDREVFTFEVVNGK